MSGSAGGGASAARRAAAWGSHRSTGNRFPPRLPLRVAGRLARPPPGSLQMGTPIGSGCGQRGREGSPAALVRSAMDRHSSGKSSQEHGVPDEIAAPEPPRLGGQAEDPLQAPVLHPVGGLALGAGEEVEGGADPDQGGAQAVAEAVDEQVLAGGAEADPDDVGPRLADPLDQLFLLALGERPERGSLRAYDLDAGGDGGQPPRQGADDLGSRPVQVVP